MAKREDRGNDIASSAFQAANASRPQELVELIRHLARLAAEEDYKYLLKTGEIPHTGTLPERSRP